MSIDNLLLKYQNVPGERFFGELFAKNEYEVVLNRPLKVVVDVGALAGEFAAYIYDKAGVIHAIEAHEPSFNELVQNIGEFGLAKIRPHKFALAGHNGTDKFTIDRTRGGNAIHPEGEGEVQTKTLAQFMKDEGITHIDVLKIDIEGGEDTVFAAKDFPEVAKQIDFIIGEHLGGAEPYLIGQGFIKKHDKEGNCTFYRE